jgi:transketolase
MLAQNYPTPVEFVGVNDAFGQSGKAMELWQHYHLTHPYIVKAAQHAVARKK